MTTINGKIYRTTGEIENITVDTTASNLEKLQKIVGGYVELVPYGEHAFIVNEEGYVHNLPDNTKLEEDYGMCFVGNVVVFPIEFLEDF